LSKSPSLSPQRVSIKKLEREHKKKHFSKLNVHRTTRIYEDDVHTGKKLDKLHNLMHREYKTEERKHNLDPTNSEINEAAVGYPSFMRESTAHVNDPVPDLDEMVEINHSYVPQVKKEFVQKVDDSDRLYETKGKIIEEYVNDYGVDDQLVLNSQKNTSNSRKRKGSKKSRNGSRANSRRSNTSKTSCRMNSKGRKKRYYHLETEKLFVHKSSADADHYDFHQRKSKEIRRLQYMADGEQTQP
jgi:hypothetical protein